MARTYHDAPITAAQMDKVLASMNSVSKASNNGKILCVDDFGFLTAKTQQELHIGAILEPVTINENGTVTPPEGVDGFDSVTVNVSGPAPVLQNKIVTQNGTVTPDTGYDGLGQVTVDVPGGGYPEPTGTIQIASNGTVNVKDYASAEVNVPTGITAADEGKVVKNGALVAQTARATAITENGTYDTTENNSVTVNVSGGGGGGSTILSGTDAPTAAQGSNGDIYLQYFHSDLPSGYIQLDGIETGATRGAYINTGLNSSPDIACEIETQFTNTPTNNTWFYGAFSRYGAPILGYQSSRIEGYIVSGGLIQIYDTAKHQYKVDSSGISVDGILRQSGNWSSAPTGVPLYLFSRGGDNNSINNTKIFSCKMWDNGNLVRHFIPAKDSNDVLGLYDLVNDVFYMNAGTQSFVAGKAMEEGKILSAFCKVNGSWLNLIGVNISDVNTGAT